MNLVIDANVLIKFYVPEGLFQKAEHLLNDAERGKIALVAPDLIYSEVGNILWKKCRLNELTITEIREISDAVATLPLITEPLKPLFPLAVDMGIEFNITVYDATYVALAKLYNTKLVTADKKLTSALSGSDLKDHVLWLGIYK